QRGLDVGDLQFAEVEDAGGQHGVRARLDGGREVLDRPGAAAGDHRHGHRLPDAAQHLQVEAGLGAVGVHGVQQDLPDAEVLAAAGPLDRVDTGALAAAVGGDLEAGGR